MVPKPHQAQREVLREARRYNIVVCGRRWGKTTLAVRLAILKAIRGYPVGWFAPTYKLLSDAWREIYRRSASVIVRSNKQEMRLEFPTGGAIDFWSLDDPDAGRGRKYALVIIDEAAKARHLSEAWPHAIRPTLTDYRGSAWFLSTPKGRNYFHELFTLARHSDDWSAHQMPTSTNPYISPEELEAARRELPALVWAQEYEAQFIDAEGGVFRDAVLDAAFALEGPEDPKQGHRYIAGVDLARTVDYTDVRILDVTEMPARLVAHQRWQGTSWTVTVERIVGLLKRYNAHARIDATGVGDPVFEALHKRWPRLEAIKFSPQVKTELVENLLIRLEQGEILLYDADGDVLDMELRAFKAEQLPSGHIRYSAPDGMHDDSVMALALAAYRMTPRRSVFI